MSPGSPVCSAETDVLGPVLCCGAGVLSVLRMSGGVCVCVHVLVHVRVCVCAYLLCSGHSAGKDKGEYKRRVLWLNTLHFGVYLCLCLLSCVLAVYGSLNIGTAFVYVCMCMYVCMSVCVCVCVCVCVGMCMFVCVCMRLCRALQMFGQCYGTLRE